jgi:hypothetical protein
MPKWHLPFGQAPGAARTIFRPGSSQTVGPSGCPLSRSMWSFSSMVHRMLTRSTYAGRHEFNKPGKTKELKPVDEVIAVEVPPII